MPKWIVVSAHGVWVPGEVFTIPDGMTVRFFCHHGVPTYVDTEIDKAAAQGTEPSMSKVKEELTAGQECHEYMLSYPQHVNPIGKGYKKVGNLYKINRGNDVPLSAVLELSRVKICDIVYIYACRSAPRRQYVGHLTNKRVQEIRRNFTENSNMRDIEEFMEDKMAWTLRHLDGN